MGLREAVPAMCQTQLSDFIFATTQRRWLMSTFSDEEMETQHHTASHCWTGIGHPLEILVFTVMQTALNLGFNSIGSI